MNSEEKIRNLENALSRDDIKMNEVEDVILKCEDDEITDIVSNLSLTNAKLLLQKLHLGKPSTKSFAHSKWILRILTVHLRHFQSCEDAGKDLNRFKPLLEKTKEKREVLHKLKGCLEMLIDQAELSKAANPVLWPPPADYQSDLSSIESDGDDNVKDKAPNESMEMSSDSS